MNTSTVSKTDFIKFNVSPTFKSLALKKARAYGMTLSELGRMLFGSFVADLPHTPISPKFLDLAHKAKKNHKENKGILIKSKRQLESFLKTI